MAENFPYLIKININLYIQKAQHTPSRINSKGSLPKHILIKLLKASYKQKILKATGEIPFISYKWSQQKGCVVAMQQTRTHGRESELSSCFGTNYPVLLRFGKVTSASETVLGTQHWWGVQLCPQEFWSGQGSPADAVLPCLEGGDLRVGTWKKWWISNKIGLLFLISGILRTTSRVALARDCGS